MREGEQLRNFIDNQSKTKISIAKGLGITKQTLFQYFKSSTLDDQTKSRLEKYFGKKIFVPVEENASTDNDKKGQYSNTDPENLEKAILHLSETDHINARNIERLITLLELKLTGKVNPLELPTKGTPGTRTYKPEGKGKGK